VHIIASTGFHRRRYYGAEAPLWAQPVAQATTIFLREIREGLAETRESARPVRPGLIKIAAEASLADSPRHLFEAAAAAAGASGYAIEMHTEKGAAAEDFLAFFEGVGLAPERLVFCHMDKRPDLALHQELAQAGVMLEYDTFYRPKYAPERHLWPLLVGMVEAGYGERLALATDMADGAMWQGFGGQPGLIGLTTEIRPRLAQIGFDKQTIRQLLGENIIARLALPSEKLQE
jgi:phosphotriesterase-related protein